LAARAQKTPVGSIFLLACFQVARAYASPEPSPQGGFTLSANLVHAAYHVRGVPSVIVHAPTPFDGRAPLKLVVFLHGYSGCIPVLMGRGESRCRANEPAREGWDLGAFHDAAHTNTLFVVPQLAYMKRDGRPGAFAEQGAFRAFLEELLGGPLAKPLKGPRKLSDVVRIDFIAHSAGYQTALAIVQRGALPDNLIQSVVLFDALYNETYRFARYIESRAASGFRFVSVSLPRGIPHRQSQQLLRRLRRTLGQERVVTADAKTLAQTVAKHAIVIAEGTPPHRLVPANHLAEVLQALHQPLTQ
jgi:hypothetical protein